MGSRAEPIIGLVILRVPDFGLQGLSFASMDMSASQAMCPYLAYFIVLVSALPLSIFSDISETLSCTTYSFGILGLSPTCRTRVTLILILPNFCWASGASSECIGSSAKEGIARVVGQKLGKKAYSSLIHRKKDRFVAMSL